MFENSRSQYPDDLFRSLSLLAPSRNASDGTLIFTARPWRWVTFLREKSTRFWIIDLSSLATTSYPLHLELVNQPRQFRSPLERSVAETFLARGWKGVVNNLIYEYPRLNQICEIDLTLLDEAGSVYVLLEVKSPSSKGYSQLADVINQKFLSLNFQLSAIWFGATDGSTYYFVHTASGISAEFSHAPTYLELEQVLTGEGMLESPANVSSEKVHSLAELRQIVMHTTAAHAVVDESVWGLRLSKSKMGSSSSQSSFEVQYTLLEMLAQLESQISSITSMTPTSWLSSTKVIPTRKALAEKFGVNAIAEISGRVPGLPYRFDWSIVVLGCKPGSTLFEKVYNHSELLTFLSQPWYLNVTEWLEGRQPESGKITKLRSEDPWTWSAQDPTLDKIKSMLKSQGNLVPLGEVCEIRLGINIAAHSKDIVSTGGIALLTGSGLTADGLVPDENKMLAPTDSIEGCRIQKGDILTRRFSNQKPIFYLVTTEVNAVASDSILILRPRLPDVSPNEVCNFLNSSIAEPLIRAATSQMQTATSQTLNLFPSTLFKLPIPIKDLAEPGLEETLPDTLAPEVSAMPAEAETIKPDGDQQIIQNLISQIQSVEMMLREKAQDIEKERNDCLQNQNQKDVATKLHELFDRAAMLTKGVRLIEQFDFSVSTFYPFPLAYSYRKLQGIVNQVHRYQEILRCWENLLAFAASVSLSLLTKDDRSAKIDPKIWQGGVSPGHWRDLLRLSGACFADYDNVPLCKNLSGLKIADLKRPFGKSCELLVTTINDFKHHRGPRSERDYVDGCNQLLSGLRVCMESLSFLTRFPIRQVKDIDINRSGKIRLTCLRFMGDHPGFIQETLELGHPLPKDDLYIEVSEDTWVSLYPFLSVRSCPECKATETFFIDSWNTKKQSLQLKSFEYGHSAKDEDSHQYFKDWSSSTNQQSEE